MSKENSPLENLLQNLESHRNSVYYIDLSNQKIGDEGAIRLAKVIDESYERNIINDINLSNNEIGKDGLLALLGILVYYQSLKDFDLSNNRIDDRGANLLKHLIEQSKTVTSLNLKNNQIGDRGAKILAEKISQNQVLRRINLSGNKIGFEGIRALRSATSANRTLLYINLDGNIAKEDEERAKSYLDRIKGHIERNRKLAIESGFREIEEIIEKKVLEDKAIKSIKDEEERKNYPLRNYIYEEQDEELPEIKVKKEEKELKSKLKKSDKEKSERTVTINVDFLKQDEVQSIKRSKKSTKKVYKALVNGKVTDLEIIRKEVKKDFDITLPTEDGRCIIEKIPDTGEVHDIFVKKTLIYKPEIILKAVQLSIKSIKPSFAISVIDQYPDFFKKVDKENTVLRLACFYNCSSLIESCIRNGANVTYLDEEGTIFNAYRQRHDMDSMSKPLVRVHSYIEQLSKIAYSGKSDKEITDNVKKLYTKIEKENKGYIKSVFNSSLIDKSFFSYLSSFVCISNNINIMEFAIKSGYSELTAFLTNIDKDKKEKPSPVVSSSSTDKLQISTPKDRQNS